MGEKVLDADHLQLSVGLFFGRVQAVGGVEGQA
jgi:hypothetical protein